MSYQRVPPDEPYPPPGKIRIFSYQDFLNSNYYLQSGIALLVKDLNFSRLNPLVSSVHGSNMYSQSRPYPYPPPSGVYPPPQGYPSHGVYPPPQGPYPPPQQPPPGYQGYFNQGQQPYYPPPPPYERPDHCHHHCGNEDSGAGFLQGW
ncbi:hypothetical protein ABZP36_024523 [Zizania latifolia]